MVTIGPVLSLATTVLLIVFTRLRMKAMRERLELREHLEMAAVTAADAGVSRKERQMETADLIIRGGTVFDGSGGEPFEADVAVKDGRIAAVGRCDGGATEEIDARGRMVTPGFVDAHTHYDGQLIWSG